MDYFVSDRFETKKNQADQVAILVDTENTAER